MEIAELFGQNEAFDPKAADPTARRLVEASASSAALGAQVGAIGSVVDDAAAVVTHALRPWIETNEIEDAALQAVHRTAVLALLVDRHTGEIIGDSDPTELARAAAGQPVEEGSALAGYVLSIHEGLKASPGWSLQGAQWCDELADLLAGWGQEARLLPGARASAFGPALSAATRGGWLDAIIEASCMAVGDQVRVSDDRGAQRVARLASSTVGVARDVGKHLHGEGSSASKELVCQRFAVAPHVIRLDDRQIVRALRAILELEVRDLLDAIDRLDASQPRPKIVRRAVLAMLELDGSSHAVVTATTGARPSRRELMAEMRKVARADGKITSDERALLRGLDAHLVSFADLLQRIESQKHAASVERSPEAELDHLRQTRQTILDDLFRIALADQHVAGDERELLLRALELVPSLR